MKRKILKIGIILLIILAKLGFGINAFVVFSTKNMIVTDYSQLEDVDCILMLGAGVWDGKPSYMLEDRLLKE